MAPLPLVLSGPIPEGIQVDRQQSNLVTTHVLKSAVHPVDVTDETLDGNLKTFWELESLGIKPRTYYEKFKSRYPSRTTDMKSICPGKHHIPVFHRTTMS